MPEAGFVEMLIQGGSVGVALVSLFLVYRVIQIHFRQTTSIIEKNAESNVKLAVSIEGHSAAIDSLKQAIENKL